MTAEVNHFEGMGVKAEKLGAPDEQKLAKELAQVIGAVLHLAMHYGLRNELSAYVDEAYQQVVSEGLVEPFPDTVVEVDERDG